MKTGKVKVVILKDTKDEVDKQTCLNKIEEEIIEFLSSGSPFSSDLNGLSMETIEKMFLTKHFYRNRSYDVFQNEFSFIDGERWPFKVKFEFNSKTSEFEYEIIEVPYDNIEVQNYYNRQNNYPEPKPSFWKRLFS